MGLRDSTQISQRPRLCVVCERIIDYVPGKVGRPPKYCSASCRADDYRAAAQRRGR